MSAPGTDRQPAAGAFWFGRPEQLLFGFLHTPSERWRDTGVVLCQPVGHELIQTHRAHGQLARLLAEAGYPVLRFDYSCSGDSAGRCEDASLAGWLEDVASAMTEMRRRCGLERLCMLGTRVGAALAVTAAAEAGGVEALVLWDPVVRGRDYLKELDASQRELLRVSHVMPDGPVRDEILGLAFPPRLREELLAVDLLALRGAPSGRALVIDPDGSGGELGAHLADLGVRVDHGPRSDATMWRWQEDVGKVLVPRSTLEGAVTWLSEQVP